MNKEMTKELYNILDFITSYTTSKGFPPTYREISEEFAYKSISTVSNRLKLLEKIGKIRLNPNKSRSIEIIDLEFINFSNLHENESIIAIPLLGNTTAGLPKEAIITSDELFYISKNLLGVQGELFMLKVEGFSMINIGINDGDLIVIKKQNHANNNDIILAQIEDNCATVKRFIIEENGNVILRPENKYMEDLVPKQLKILGIIVGCLKTKFSKNVKN